MNLFKCKREIFHHGVGEQFLSDFSRDALSVFPPLGGNIHLDELSDADILDVGIAQRMNTVLDRLPLRVENGFS